MREQQAGNGATRGQAEGDGSGSLQELQTQLSEERSRAEGYLAQWQRASADFQNF